MAAAPPAAAFIAAGYALFTLMGLWDPEPYVPDVGTMITAARQGLKWNKAEQRFQRYGSQEEAEAVADMLARGWSSTLYNDYAETGEVIPKTEALYKDVYGDKPMYVSQVPEGDEDLYERVGVSAAEQAEGTSVPANAGYRLKEPTWDQAREALYDRAEKSALDFGGATGGAGSWWTNPPDAPADEDEEENV